MISKTPKGMVLKQHYSKKHSGYIGLLYLKLKVDFWSISR